MPTSRIRSRCWSRWLAPSLLVGLGLMSGCERARHSTPEPAQSSTASASVVPAASVSLRSSSPDAVALAATNWMRSCEPSHTPAGPLLARAATLTNELGNPDPAYQRPWDSLARAIAWCSPRAELELRSWLEGIVPQREAAARAMGALAKLSGGLGHETTVALLQQPPELLAQSWFGLYHAGAPARALAQPISQLGQLHREYWAVRTLAKIGMPALARMAELVVDSDAPTVSRLAAVEGLAQLGAPGQQALADLIRGALPPPLEAKLLDTLERRWIQPARPALLSMLEQQLPDGQPARRRAVRRRCQAAALLSDSLGDPRLEQCDPDQGRAAKLARLRVIARNPLDQARLQWLELVKDDDPVVSAQALELLSRWPETADLDEILAQQLGSSRPAAVTAAAKVIANVASVTQMQLDTPRSLAALSAALAKPSEKVPVLSRLALIRAASQLQMRGLKPQLSAFCQSEQAIIRDAAQHALARLQADGCPGPRLAPHPPAAPTAAPRPALRLTFQLDSGPATITLDGKAAPESVKRIQALVEAGTFSRAPVVVRVDDHLLLLGDPDADGLTHERDAQWRSELSPQRFDALSVAVAQNGSGALAPQLLITLAPRPDMELTHTLVGRASDAWREVDSGTRIHSVTADRPKQQ